MASTGFPTTVTNNREFAGRHLSGSWSCSLVQFYLQTKLPCFLVQSFQRSATSHWDYFRGIMHVPPGWQRYKERCGQVVKCQNIIKEASFCNFTKVKTVSGSAWITTVSHPCWCLVITLPPSSWEELKNTFIQKVKRTVWIHTKSLNTGPNHDTQPTVSDKDGISAIAMDRICWSQNGIRLRGPCFTMNTVAFYQSSTQDHSTNEGVEYKLMNRWYAVHWLSINFGVRQDYKIAPISF